MNYSTNTFTPIADAARFFNEIEGNIRYEEIRYEEPSSSGRKAQPGRMERNAVKNRQRIHVLRTKYF
ncbi:hypothetical protein IMPR6_240007 [Imperialibacter sp. EC-SDR9]|nr:hypothetical protein IMPERIA89_590007 [Imperialibacter sp. 89]VVT15913.1 hypothetical protein IMPR6_240007 [Imperialibacter sp. EC-SDR9]